MDQAISFLAEQGVAMRIRFDPLSASPVSIPQGGMFVVSNCLVESNKAETAHLQFNKRVVECRLACLIVSQAVVKDPATRNQLLTSSYPRHTLRLVLEASGMDLVSFTDAALGALHSSPYTVKEIAETVGYAESEVERYLEVGGRAVAGPFMLHNRTKHVLSEATRVELFEKNANDSHLTAEERLKTLGSLMNASHESCSQHYDCSCENLDSLVAVCREAGALGSRLTGAGWGGCVVSLVNAPDIQKFLDTVWGKYYECSDIRKSAPRDKVLFASLAGTGGRVWKP
eukprot:c8998_g1_i2.p1 GENE.c8998_g1_i2~~c8998_g1_i2.p1  ORF type:complete len:286 (+),score=75.04 c8998_g1_i2:776-1633(+)